MAGMQSDASISVNPWERWVNCTMTRFVLLSLSPSPSKVTCPMQLWVRLSLVTMATAQQAQLQTAPPLPPTRPWRASRESSAHRWACSHRHTLMTVRKRHLMHYWTSSMRSFTTHPHTLFHSICLSLSVTLILIGVYSTWISFCIHLNVSWIKKPRWLTEKLTCWVTDPDQCLSLCDVSADCICSLFSLAAVPATFCTIS